MSDTENASLITSLYSEIGSSEPHPVQVTVQLDQEGNSVINIPEASPAKEDMVTYYYRCGLCQLDFVTYQELTNHLKHLHLRNYQVSLLGKDNDYSNIKHVIVITGTEAFQCELCNVQFAESELAREHFNTHHGSQHDKCVDGGVIEEEISDQKTSQVKKPFLCNVCGRGFSKQSNVARHKKTHSFEKCKYCDKMFLIHSDLEKHLSSHKENWTDSVKFQVDESKEKGKECLDGIVSNVGMSTSNENVSTKETDEEQTSILEQLFA